MDYRVVEIDGTNYVRAKEVILVAKDDIAVLYHFRDRGYIQLHYPLGDRTAFLTPEDAERIIHRKDWQTPEKWQALMDSRPIQFERTR